MNVSQAREIIEALANGVNPTTGEVFDDDHCFNDPDIIRALFVATDELKKAEWFAKHKNSSKAEKSQKSADNAGKPWTRALDAELKNMFLSRKSQKEICDHFKRTPRGIAARLVRLGLIQSRQEFK